MKRSKRIVRAALLVLFVGATILSAGVLRALNQHFKTAIVVEQGDPLWIASQLQLELLRLKDTIHYYDDGMATADDVALRFDIAWSRINVMQSGQMAEFSSVIPKKDNPIDSLEEVFIEIEPVLQSLISPETPLSDRAEITELLQTRLHSYDRELRRFAILMAQVKAASMHEYRINALSLSKEIAFLFTAIMLLATTFCAFLIVDLRESRATTTKMKKLAEEANSISTAKDKFMSSVSHELRTPLTSIHGAIGLLKNSFETMPATQANTIINIAERNSERLMTLVNDILDAQQIVEGKVKLRKERANMSAIIRTAVEDCRAFADQMNVTYCIEPSDTPLMVMADKDRISQVVCNLLSNAAKFSKPNDKVIVRAAKSGKKIKVEVEDHGVGIATSEHPNIFTRFHQISPGETGPNKSSGLGLSISKELIDMHGGDIGFSSSLGHGSTFWFTLSAAD
ncbi:HAMP domain-containing sensor histidine kinase [Roseovarius aestuarii]|nr:HAMP domain-containing sensor histidine kinase [Roseovarius aestuarii]